MAGGVQPIDIVHDPYNDVHHKLRLSPDLLSGSYPLPPLKDVGPFEAGSSRRMPRCVRPLPPLKVGGPIEAYGSWPPLSLTIFLPPLKDGGPIEASLLRF